jgi:hypothetical protein
LRKGLEASEVYNGKLALSWIILHTEKDEPTHEERVHQHIEHSHRIVAAIIAYIADNVYISIRRRTRTLTPFEELTRWQDSLVPLPAHARFYSNLAGSLE